MTPFITVLLVVCLNAANHDTCTKIPITDSSQAQEENVPPVSMAGCLSLQGLLTAKKYWDEHPDLHEKFQFGGVACQIGNRAPPQPKDNV